VKVAMTTRSGEEARKMLKDQAFATPEKVAEMVSKVYKAIYSLQIINLLSI
jgi:hypothetical protein